MLQFLFFRDNAQALNGFLKKKKCTNCFATFNALPHALNVNKFCFPTYNQNHTRFKQKGVQIVTRFQKF